MFSALLLLCWRQTFKTKTFEAAKCPGKSTASKTSQIKFKQASGCTPPRSAGSMGLRAGNLGGCINCM